MENSASAIDGVCRLTSHILDELSRGSNYYQHTTVVWRLVESLVAQGRTINSDNPDTGDQADGPVLAGLAQDYVAGYLAESVFQNYVSLFEDYTFGLIGFWLMAYPKGIVGLDDDESDNKLKKVERSVPLSLITDSPDRETILRVVVDRELDRLKYRRLAAWFDYLEKRARLGTPSLDQIERLAEIKASRDLIVHNRGIVNATYRSKSGTKSRYADGDRLEIIEPYLRESWLLINEVVRATAAAVLGKLEKSADDGATGLGLGTA